MKFINQCLAEGVTNEPKKLAFEEWKDMADLTDAGFKLFAAIANIDEECFDKVDRKFIESSMKLLTGYPTRRVAQTQAMNFFSNLDLKEVQAKSLLEFDLIKHLYSVLLTNIGWKKIGNYVVDLLDTISDISDKMVEMLVKKDAVKALVSILHFIDDTDPEFPEELRE